MDLPFGRSFCPRAGFHATLKRNTSPRRPKDTKARLVHIATRLFRHFQIKIQKTRQPRCEVEGVALRASVVNLLSPKHAAGLDVIFFAVLFISKESPMI